MITRRQLLVAASAVPVAAVAGATAAEAKPIVYSDSTVRTWGPVMLIGDSLSGGFIGGLRKEIVKQGIGPFRYDIQGSRSINRDSKKFPSGITAVRSARAAHFDPPSWVVALGGNDMWFVGAKTGAAKTMIDQILTEIGDRHVFFLTYWQRTLNSYPKFNAALVDATSRWPKLHVADWAALAKKHPDWHGADGAHYNGKGAVQRNLFTVATMIDAVKAAQTPPPPPTTTDPPPSSTDAPQAGVARMSTGFDETQTCSHSGGAHVV